MDAKKTLASWPLSGGLFLILLSSAFYFGYTHDQKVLADIYVYHANHLLKTEAPLFEDFYRKRLAIEQTGSAALLNRFQLARQNNQQQTLSRIIISDRSFRPYLHNNTHLLFTTHETERWREHSTMLSGKIQQLAAYQFGLIPERFAADPQFSRLFTYLFIDPQIYNLFSNSLILLCLFILMEHTLHRLKFWTSAFGLSLLHGLAYLTVADQMSSPLYGVNILVYFCASLAIFMAIQKYRTLKTRPQLFLVLILSLVYLLKLFIDFYFTEIFPEQLAGILISAITAGALSWQGIFQSTDKNISDPEPNHQADQQDLTSDQRKDYHEALTALARFNFAYARDRLRSLHLATPDSLQILESLYHLEKLHPDEQVFWQLTEQRLVNALQQDKYQTLLGILKDIQHYAGLHKKPDAAINPEYYLQIMRMCLQQQHFDKAEQAFSMLQSTPATLDKQLNREACQLLINFASDRQLLTKKTHYQALFSTL